MIDPGLVALRVIAFLLRNRAARLALVLLMLVVIGVAVHAQTDAAPSTVMGMIDGKFQPLQAQWSSAIKGTAIKLFLALMGLDFTVSRALKLLEGGDTIESIVGGLGKQILRYSFFFALLKFADTWLPAIIDSFRKIGSNAAGAAPTTPDGILDAGTTTALAVIQSLHTLGLGDAMMMAVPLMLVALIVFFCFVFVAIQVLVTNIEIYLMCGAGVILLGMGGSLWTKDMAVNVYKYALQVGVKLMVLILIVGAGQSIFAGQLIDQDNFLRSVLQVAAVAGIYAYLSFKAPALASGMLSGSSSLSAGEAMGTALGLAAGGAALGAGAVAGAGLAAQGASAAAGGATNAIAGAQGLGQALGAGFESAADKGKSGMGAAAHAVGEVGGHGMGIARTAMGNAAERASEAYGAKVASSTGAKIAQSIEGTRGGSLSQAGPQGGDAGGANAASGGAAGDGPSAGQGSSDGASASASGPQAEASQGAGAQGQSVMQSLGAGGGGGGAAPAGSGAPKSAVAASPVGEEAGGTGGGGSTSAGVGSPGGATSPSAPGNAAGATLEGGSSTPAGGGAGPSSGKSGGGQPYQRSLHETLSGLKGHIPDDSAAAAHVAIDTNAHGR